MAPGLFVVGVPCRPPTFFVMELIVLATANPHKVAELRGIFGEAGLCVIGLDEAASGNVLAEPAEIGTTFDENAAIKARSYAEQVGCICLADDSGLEIDALGGRPGVISSHYATDGRETGVSRAERDAANNARVLRELSGVPDERRTARFVCVMCVAGPGAGSSRHRAELSKDGLAAPVMCRGEQTGSGMTRCSLSVRISV